jgi:hypothetical protein
MRQERGWSQQHAFEELRVGLHLGPKSRASYRALDVGERLPTPSEQEFFVKYFRKSPDDFPEAVEPTEPADALVEALRSQTEAISDLAITPGGLIILVVVLGSAIWWVRGRTAPESPDGDGASGSQLHRLLKGGLGLWAIAYPVMSCAPLFMTGVDSGGAAAGGGLASLVVGATLFGPWIVGLLVLGVLVWVTD